MGAGSFLDHLAQAHRLGGTALASAPAPSMLAVGGLLLGLLATCPGIVVGAICPPVMP